MANLHLKITTNEKVVFDEDVKEIYLKGSQGEFGILPNHIPFMTPLEIGVTKIVTENGIKFYTVMGGIFQLKDNEALILTQTAEDAEIIDVERALAAEKRAKERLKEDGSDLVDYRRAEIALAKAMARLKAANKH
ncbi:MAG: ATP synthase F1 subunit epsilon [Candidatus Melainabacteria bacterium]|nr:MAG: ATP synthase F1 subunit epsilon [Candidatus Melainabacteria bacterium]